MIRVRGLVNRFGAQVVHDGLDMDVQSNEIFGIVGGSGAGKSVLLRTILGLRHPDAGTVELYGKNVQQMAVADRSALVQSYGVTFQNGALISSLTVAQNIQLPLREYLPASERILDELAELNLALVGLAPEAGEEIPLAAVRRHGQTRRAGARAQPRTQAPVPRRADRRPRSDFRRRLR